METSKRYDLLPVDNRNDIFRVTFDLFTARPHFMLFPQTGIEDLKPDHSLTSLQKQQLIVTARGMLSFLNISCGTLSIHRGSWISKYSTTPHFHLCVDANTYLIMFHAKKKTDYSSWFDDPAYADENFRTYFDKQFSGNFLKMVEEYPLPKYHKEEVKEIQDIIKNNASNSSPEKQSASENTENLFYHRAHPKIGFRGDGTAEGLNNILIEMEEYAERNNLTTINSENEDDGCHLCLSLGSDSEWNLPEGLATVPGIVGYIVVSGPRFYQLCPKTIRDSWFKAFRSSKFECKT